MREIFRQRKILTFTAGATAIGLTLLSACADDQNEGGRETASPFGTPTLTATPKDKTIHLESSPRYLPSAAPLTEVYSQGSSSGLGGMLPGIPQGGPFPTRDEDILETPTPTPTPIYIPTPVLIPPPYYEVPPPCYTEKWTEGDIVSSLTFTREGIDDFDNILAVGEIPSSELKAGESPFFVPQEGLATLNFQKYKNLVYVWGHSADPVTLERRKLADLEFINAGDFIYVKNQNDVSFCFKVSDFILTPATQEGGAYLKDYDESTLIVQFSAKSTSGMWLLDENNVKAKAGINITNDLDQYLVFFIRAYQVLNS